MITKLGVILEKTTHGFESEGVLNPAIMQEGEEVHMFYRAFRSGNFSTLGYCRLHGPVTVAERSAKPVFEPAGEHERQGVEDARLTRLDGRYYMTYTAYDGHNALGCVAVSDDLRSFSRCGAVTPKITFDAYYEAIRGNEKLNSKYLQQYRFLAEHGMFDKVSDYLVWDKNLVIFPEKFDGRFAMLHRLFPGIQIVYFNDFAELGTEFWLHYLERLDERIVMDPAFYYETSHIGAGCPPIATDAGWLLIYHAVEVTAGTNVYHASAALLDRNDPQRVIARLRTPLISPLEEWEKNGYVSNVCFPTGTALFGDDLHIYYGAADSRIAVARTSLKGLINELLTNHLWTYEN